MMPVSSVEGLLSTSVYFVAVLLLMAVVTAPLASLYRGASAQAAETLAKGVAGQVDALSPGMETEVEFDSYPGASVSVQFSGAGVTATVNGFSFTVTAHWPLSAADLGSGRQYDVMLSDGVVTVG